MKYFVAGIIHLIVFMNYFEGPGHLVTLVRMSKWSLRLWLHKERNRHFAWEMTFLWQYCLRGHTCCTIISSNDLHRFPHSIF